MVARRQLQRAPAEIGAGPGIGGRERLTGPQEDRDRLLVAGLGARRDLRGDLDGRGAGREEHVGRLAVERLAGRQRDAVTNGVAGDVMAECETVAALDEHPAVDELLHRAEQPRRGPVEHGGQVRKGEPAAERGRDRGGLARGRGDAAQPLAHRGLDAPGQPGFDQLGLTGDNADQGLVTEAGQQLHEQERTAARALDEVEERVVGFGVHYVLGHLGHGGVVERSEDDPLGPAVVQMLDRAEELRRALVGAEGEDPTDRQVAEPDGQRAQCRGGPAVGPLEVVERDQERPVQCGALEHRLQVLQQPVTLLGQRVELP